MIIANYAVIRVTFILLRLKITGNIIIFLLLFHYTQREIIIILITGCDNIKVFYFKTSNK